MSYDFIDSSMSLEEQVRVWEREYRMLHQKWQSDVHEHRQREDKEVKLIKQYQAENAKMARTNEMGVALVENLKKQILKYQNNDHFEAEKEKGNGNDSNHLDVESWKTRYIAEQRTSEYLREECEDLQTEIEVLKEKGPSSSAAAGSAMNSSSAPAMARQESEKAEMDKVLAVVNEAWEEEVTALIEQFRSNDIDVDEFRNNFSRKLMANAVKDAVMENACDYEAMYTEAVKSKMRLIEVSSIEIQKLRHIIRSQNGTVYRSVFDRIVRYHNLEGGEEDTIFQIMVDSGLKK